MFTVNYVYMYLYYCFSGEWYNQSAFCPRVQLACNSFYFRWLYFEKKLLLFFKLKSFNIGKLIWRIPFVSSIIRRKMSPFEVTCFYLLLIFYFLLLYFFVHWKQSYLLTKWIAELCLLIIFKLTWIKCPLMTAIQFR